MRPVRDQQKQAVSGLSEAWHGVQQQRYGPIRYGCDRANNFVMPLSVHGLLPKTVGWPTVMLRMSSIRWKSKAFERMQLSASVLSKPVAILL